MKILMRAIRGSLMLFIIGAMTGCCGGLKMWGGEHCDNLFTPNWDNRHAKFVNWMNAEVGKPFQTSVMCNSKYEHTEILDKGHTRYAYSHGPGCTYYCVVDSNNKVVSTSFEGTKETCYLTLN